MIDHILVYPSTEARDAAWPAPVDLDGNPTHAPSWTDAGRDVMPARIVHARAAYDAEGFVSPEVVAPGAWLIVRSLNRDPGIEALAEAVIVTDAGMASSGAPYVIKCSLAPETILGQVDPIWAGSDYAIPVGLPASALDTWRIDA